MTDETSPSRPPRKLRIERGPYAPPADGAASPQLGPQPPQPGPAPAQPPAPNPAAPRRLGPPPAAPRAAPPPPPAPPAQPARAAEPPLRSRPAQPPQPTPQAAPQPVPPRPVQAMPGRPQPMGAMRPPPVDTPPPMETLPGSGGGAGQPPEPPRPAWQAFLIAALRWVAWLLGRIAAWVAWIVWFITWRAAIVLVGILGLATLYNMSMLPPSVELTDARVRGSVTMSDRNGEVFAWRGDQFGGLVTVDSVSPHLRNAIIATEDRRFYSHWGLSPRGIASAIRINLSEGRGPLSGNGGSTITQQVAKLLCLGNQFDPDAGMTEAEYEADCREGSVWRKIKEVPYALALEGRYTKDEILTIYLNRAYLGAGARGFEAASRRYFGKAASAVNPAEAAMLAGLLIAPSRFAPTNDLDRAQRRAATIVRLMEDQGLLSAEQAAEARANPAQLSEAAKARAGGYFADWVMETGPSFLTRDTTEDVLIRTTLDQRIQRAAEEALQVVFDTQVREGSEAQAAIVVMSSDGAVRAMVGGRNIRSSGQFNRATQALRQTGSAFKPFVYAAALDLGMRYDDIVYDTPLTIDVPGSGPWSPRNYTNEFAGPVSLTEALAGSLNIPAIRISEQAGRENVRKVAEGFGIARDLALGPALALGVSEATLLEMTAAYAGILNGGSSVAPYGLEELRISGDASPLMTQGGGIRERVISVEAAAQLTYMMHAVIEQGTGRRAKLPNHPAAAKTGTTQAARDAWFVGFTADYVTGVWMGYDDNTPLSGVTGGGLPADIWRETMVRIHEGLPPLPLPMDVPPPRAGDTFPPLFGQGEPQPQTQPRNDPAPNTAQSAAERVLLDVLGALLGRNN